MSKRKWKTLLLGAALGALLPMTARAADLAATETARLRALQAQFAPVEIKTDLSALPASEYEALRRLVEASKYMDSLFLRQVWAGNEQMLLDLEKDPSELGRARLNYFRTHMGPWDRQNKFEAFIPGAPSKPPQGNFYPSDATKEEVDKWITSLDEKQRHDARFFYTTVRRGPDGALMLVPYSVEYQGELIEVARLRRDAAALTRPPSLTGRATPAMPETSSAMVIARGLTA